VKDLVDSLEFSQKKEEIGTELYDFCLAFAVIAGENVTPSTLPHQRTTITITLLMRGNAVKCEKPGL
jgi:hypothetical protein